MKVEQATKITAHTNLFWDLYQSTFEPARTECIQEQCCYDQVLFREALTDEEMIKFVVYEADRPIGLALATFNLDKARIAYVNPKRLEAECPNYLGRILYFTCIAVHSDFQSKNIVFVELVKEFIVYANKHKAMVAFDFSTEKNAMLPRALVAIAQRTEKVKPETERKTPQYRSLGGQEYGVIEFN